MTRFTDTDSAQVLYTYDNLYRLTQEERTGADTYISAYTYDPVGNRLTKTKTAEDVRLTTDTYNQNNQLLSEVTYSDTTGYDTTTYAYDNNGNLTQKTAPGNNVTTYTYNYENKLTQSLRTGGEAISITYSYDADGNRKSKTENTVITKYINDLNQPLVQVLQEKDGSGNLIASYTYGNDLISQTRSSSTSYYLYDGLGSTRLLTDSSGDVLNTYNYDAFGNPVATYGTSPNNYRFTGEQTDGDSGLYYLRARYYDPAVGRFISRDPISYRGGINLYAYCENNPVNATDPRGLVANILPGDQLPPLYPTPDDLRKTLPNWKTLLDKLTKEGMSLTTCTAILVGISIEEGYWKQCPGETIKDKIPDPIWNWGLKCCGTVKYNLWPSFSNKCSSIKWY